ncbi:RyR domain-containing protein [Clostridium formicaceticum]|uniref:RyR domain protein n=1 Tax=Clostridium formicaceticum TaxID=1497 RepID=A0AAC9RJJ2_9CLOT|nr:RyR domain-containing protein [Clostridium formicaceticum]AOY77663.1 Ryanodine receptor Ryr [Clostridium formicaceticum]ARE88249.1 RyR domain protein [Clostridium formicaceticum]
MKNKNIKIVVTGDICINSLQWITDPQNNEGFNWQTHLNMHNMLKPGESLLLSQLVELATGASILAPKIEDMALKLSREFLHSTAELNLFPKYDDRRNEEKVYRVKHFLGFTGPSSGIPKLLPIINDDENAAMVIIDDENNGFNLNTAFWPLAIQTPEKSPIILYKTNNPNGSSKLWKHLEMNHIENTIVVINSDDLRSKGVNISKSLSWEKTAQNFLWQINNSPNLAFLANCHHLIVPFGLEGAIYYRNDGIAESRLYFLPDEVEGGFVKENQGKMYGLTSCFVAGLAQSIASENADKASLSISINDGIRQGIVAAHKYFIEGFGENLEESPFPHPSIFIEDENHFIYKEHVQDVRIPCSSSTNCSSCWYILKDKSSANLAEIAYDIVKNGEGRVAKFIPIAQFGNLKTVDRVEIESYRSIKNLMWEYVSSKNTVRPLSIAIFGTPGSGKSFGVTEIAASIAPKLIKKLDFNLSQFRSPSDLINAFHRVRDYSLQGRIPLVFFDEFDSSFEGKLGWLKYFLAPMQDGVFREGEATHPIGKAILVFAGGTASTFKEFWGKNLTDENEQKQFLLEFKNAKGPDFVSRLRGYVNILGVNQTTDSRDQLFIIRRAMLLRSFLQRKVPHLINDKGEAQIDNGVLRALLKVPRYKHESRSMEAILEMSMLAQAKKWEQSHLPSREQLKLHVDEEQFLRHMMHDSFYSEKIENLAIAAHEKYISLYADNKEIDPNFVQPWQSLSEYLKDCSRDQAKHIPDALLKINYDIVSVKDKPPIKEFTDSELKILAAHEHTRWSLHRKEAGWKYGPVKDYKKKTEPALVSWDVLPHEKKIKLYEIVKIWPEILANANFAIEQLTFSRNCEALG